MQKAEVKVETLSQATKERLRLSAEEQRIKKGETFANKVYIYNSRSKVLREQIRSLELQQYKIQRDCDLLRAKLYEVDNVITKMYQHRTRIETLPQ